MSRRDEDEDGGGSTSVDILHGATSVINAFTSVFGAVANTVTGGGGSGGGLRPTIAAGAWPTSTRPRTAQDGAGGDVGRPPAAGAPVTEAATGLISKLFGSPLTYLGAAGSIGLQVFAPRLRTSVKALPLLAAVVVQVYDNAQESRP